MDKNMDLVQRVILHKNQLTLIDLGIQMFLVKLEKSFFYFLVSFNCNIRPTSQPTDHLSTWSIISCHSKCYNPHLTQINISQVKLRKTIIYLFNKLISLIKYLFCLFRNCDKNTDFLLLAILTFICIRRLRFIVF